MLGPKQRAEMRNLLLKLYCTDAVTGQLTSFWGFFVCRSDAESVTEQNTGQRSLGASGVKQSHISGCQFLFNSFAFNADLT